MSLALPDFLPELLARNKALEQKVEILEARLALLASRQPEGTPLPRPEHTDFHRQIAIWFDSEKSPPGEQKIEGSPLLVHLTRMLEKKEKELLELKGGFDFELWRRAPGLLAENLELRAKSELFSRQNSEIEQLRKKFEEVGSENAVLRLKIKELRSESIDLKKELEKKGLEVAQLQQLAESYKQLSSLSKVQGVSEEQSDSHKNYLMILKAQAERVSQELRENNAAMKNLSLVIENFGRVFGLKASVLLNGNVVFHSANNTFTITSGMKEDELASIVNVLKENAQETRSG